MKYLVEWFVEHLLKVLKEQREGAMIVDGTNLFPLDAPKDKAGDAGYEGLSDGDGDELGGTL